MGEQLLTVSTMDSLGVAWNMPGAYLAQAGRTPTSPVRAPLLSSEDKGYLPLVPLHKPTTFLRGHGLKSGLHCRPPCPPALSIESTPECACPSAITARPVINCFLSPSQLRPHSARLSPPSREIISRPLDDKKRGGPSPTSPNWRCTDEAWILSSTWPMPLTPWILTGSASSSCTLARQPRLPGILVLTWTAGSRIPSPFILLSVCSLL